MALTETGTISSSAPATAAGRNRWEGEMGFCEHCGSRVSSYPMGCPGCGAPECCQRCCDEQNKNDRIAALESRVRELEAERDNLVFRNDSLREQTTQLLIQRDNLVIAQDRLKATIARQRAWIESAGHRPGCASTRKCAHCGKPPWSYRHLVDAVGFDHDFQPGPCDCGWAELAEG